MEQQPCLCNLECKHLDTQNKGVWCRLVYERPFKRYKVTVNNSDSFEWYGPNVLTVLCTLWEVFPKDDFDVQEIPF